MIFPQDIQAAILEQVRQTFPGEQIYEDLTPRDFKRPSTLVALDRISLEQGSCNVFTLLFQFRLTTFAEVDEIHNSHFPVLDLRAMMLVAAFSQGYLRVQDRAPRITKVTANTEPFDYAEVTLTIAQGYDRSELAAPEVYQLMEDLALRTSLKEEHK